MADGEVRTGETKQGLIRKILLGLGAILLIMGVGLVVSGKTKNFDLLNPLSNEGKNTKVAGQAVVVGFLPSWMIGKTKTYGAEIDQLVFSGVGVSKDGSLVWELQSKKLNSDDYISLKNSVAKSGGKNILGIKLFDDKAIDALLASDEAKKRLYSEVADVVTVGNFDGVNIDFEYMSNPIRMLDDDFGEFLDGARTAGWKEISVDAFANTIIKGNKEGLDKLLSKVDLMEIMAYDFHQPGSEIAGAVAPMGAEAGQRSISEITENIVSFGLQKDKIIMAYPLYGYEWETETELLNSATRTAGYGATVQYKDGIGITGVNWDELSQSPWAVWQEKAQRSRIVSKLVKKKYKKVTEYYTVDQWHQAYFENEKSLGIKMEATKQAQLGGVGFWALGYEGKNSDLILNLKKLL
jgi:spore germination protein YaaH